MTEHCGCHHEHHARPVQGLCEQVLLRTRLLGQGVGIEDSGFRVQGSGFRAAI